MMISFLEGCVGCLTDIGRKSEPNPNFELVFRDFLGINDLGKGMSSFRLPTIYELNSSVD